MTATMQTGRYAAYRETAEANQLLDYWRAIRKRLWLVVGIAVLITTLTAIYMARKPNIYAARAVVQVDLEQTNPDLAVTDRIALRITADERWAAVVRTHEELIAGETLAVAIDLDDSGTDTPAIDLDIA